MNLFALNKKKLLKKIINLQKLIIFSPFLFLLILFRFFFKIKIVEIETRAIGHYAATMEIFLCEIINNIHDKSNIFSKQHSP